MKEDLCLYFFSLLLLLCLPLSVSSGFGFALQLFPLTLPTLTYQLPTLPSKQLFTPYNVLLFSFPSDAAQWLAKPGHTSVWQECGIYWEKPRRVAPWCTSGSEEKGIPVKKWLVEGWEGLHLIKGNEGGGQATQQAEKQENLVTSGQCSFSLSSWRLPSLPTSGCSQLCLRTAPPGQSLLTALTEAFLEPQERVAFPWEQPLPHWTQSAVPHLSLPYLSWDHQFSSWLGKAGEDVMNVSRESREGKMLKNCCCSSLFLISSSHKWAACDLVACVSGTSAKTSVWCEFCLVEWYK